MFTKVHASVGVTLVLTACSGAPVRPRTVVPTAGAYLQSMGWSPPPEAADLYAELRRLTNLQGLTADPALAHVAREIARRVAADPRARPPSASVVQALSWQAGITDPIPTVLTLRGPSGISLAPLANSLTEVVAEDPPTHCGIYRRQEATSDVLVVVLSLRRVQLDAVPRTLPVGASVVVHGVFSQGLRAPALAMTYPDGHTQESPLGDGPAFHSRFTVAAQGVYQVELTADSPAGSTVVANFPVYVGVPPPGPPAETSATSLEDPARAETDLLAEINRAREHAHLRPVILLGALSQVARAHSMDMAAQHYVAHDAPDGSTPGDRLRRAGIRTDLVLENVAEGYSAEEIHTGLMGSPGHRANILNAAATHVGVGAAVEDGPNRALLVTEDFIAIAPDVDVTTAPDTVLDAINQRRRRHGVPELGTRGLLQAVAQASAEAYFAPDHPTQEAVLEEATAQLAHAGLLFRRVEAAAALSDCLSPPQDLAPMLDPEMASVGIGVAQGDRPDAPPRSIFMVYVFAVPR